MNGRSLTAADLLGRYEQAMRSFDPDELAKLYAPDGVHEFAFLTPGCRTLHGREHVREHYRMLWRQPSLSLGTIERTWCYEDRGNNSIACGWVAVATPLSGGASFDLHGVLELQTRDSVLTHVHDYMDLLGFMHHTGGLSSLVEMFST